MATSLANSSVEVVWEETRGGWRAPSRQLRVEDEAMPGRRVVEREVGAGAGSVLLEGLKEEKTYVLTFSPTGPRVPQDIGQVSTFLPETQSTIIIKKIKVAPDTFHFQIGKT